MLALHEAILVVVGRCHKVIEKGTDREMKMWTGMDSLSVL